ncbi:cytoplasmic polyadenylated homeobox-like protein 2 [Marmota flaviventris]|uniref:cytoplasmic polyadenylated homeobox-like protein 2 n=1 Tax=Marmota flaviventris TaxID=93162 RepID=UPI003A88E709
MASKASSVEDSSMEVGETKQERGIGKPRHTFTKHDLEILNRSFEQNSYPDFGIREELAKQINCPISAINIWYQNKRSRLRLREKQRVFVIRRRRQFQVQGHHPVLENQESRMQYDSNTTAQSSGLQQAPHGKAGFFPVETWRHPREENGSCDDVFTGIRREPNCPSLVQGARGSGPSPRFSQAIYSHSASSVQNFEKVLITTEKSHQSMHLPLSCVSIGQGKMQQQQEQQPSGLCEGQGQSDWVYYNPQLQQPQSYQEKLSVQGPLQMYQKHDEFWKKLPSLQQEQDANWQENGEDSSSQVQCTSPPQNEMCLVPESFVLDGQQVAREQARSPTQQAWAFNSPIVLTVNVPGVYCGRHVPVAVSFHFQFTFLAESFSDHNLFGYLHPPKWAPRVLALKAELVLKPQLQRLQLAELLKAPALR